MSDEKPASLSVFLCHASQDKPLVRELRDRLNAEGWIDPWLDEDRLSLGQYWTDVIEDALYSADAIVIFLSTNSVQKEGFVQRELKRAWEISLDKPNSVIFLIPIRLDDCEIPRQLRSRQWGDYFGDKKENTYQTLIRSLRERYKQRVATDEEKRIRVEDEVQKKSEEIKSQETAKQETTLSENEEQFLKVEIQKYFKELQRQDQSNKEKQGVKQNIINTAEPTKTSKVKVPEISFPQFSRHSKDQDRENISREKKPITFRAGSNSTFRGLLSLFIHFAAISFGWFVHQWMGLLSITVPILFTYYYFLYRIAVSVVPVSNPSSKSEPWKRYRIFLSYVWGFQYPLMVVRENSWKEPDIRVSGDCTKDIPTHGIIRMKSHQVVVIRDETKFSRIAGPGVVFTNKHEQPDQIFDLRLQLRTSEINVISKDGVSFLARVFTAFRIDSESWDKETYETLLGLNPLMRGADILDHTDGSFPFSSTRVKSVLGVTSSKNVGKDSSLYWDQWVLRVVEDQSRKVISQKYLDEMWRPANDNKFANAMDVIAQEIVGSCKTILRSAGILLISARIVNFRFPSKDYDADDISKQQIAAWSSEWERKRQEILAEAYAESERSQQEANAYVQAVLLNSIAEGLSQINEINPNLSRRVIAMRFLSTLSDYINKQQEGEKEEETENKIQELKSAFKEWKNMFFPNEGEEE